MVMTLAGGGGSRFHRLFAPVFAHTIRRESRSCVGCHADPLALGYGRGTLRYEPKTRGWRFTARLPARDEDGLPADAWIGFLQVRGVESTTREDTRPFSLLEQQRLLTVGACLSCHAAESKPMRDGLGDFAAVLARRTPKCSAPDWR